MLAGLPIQLHDGSVGKVTARIPWPNPLTSAIGLSLESLHLTFIVTSTLSQGQSQPSPSDLAESVASAAENFMHDELDALEEATLRDSVHSELGGSTQSLDHVPGGLDPFLSEEGPHNEGEPPGVSIFASLVERLLARFEFDSTDLKITLVHPERASFTFTVSSVRYRTEVKDTSSGSLPSSPQAVGEQNLPGGVTRTVSVSGIIVTSRCLRPSSPQFIASGTSLATSVVSSVSHETPQAVVPDSPRPSSPYSDSSELDEETSMFMSQSLAALPPRPVSPSSSVASSMYESAISTTPIGQSRAIPRVESQRLDSPPAPTEAKADTAPAGSFQSKLVVTTNEIEDETLVSFGNEPITLRLWTPSPIHREPGSSSSSSRPGLPATAGMKRAERRDVGAVKLDITVGVVAVALRARHIRSLMDLTELWSAHSPPSAPQASKTGEPSRSFSQRVDVTLHLRGMIVSLLPGKRNADLSEYFNHPLVPPRLPHGYVRIHLEELSAALSIHPTPALPGLRQTTAAQSGNTVTGRLSLSELSAFAFIISPQHANGLELAAIPLLITDLTLPLQYDGSHIHPDLRQINTEATLPTFDVVDWTDPTRWTDSAKISAWRTKKQHASTSPVSESPRNHMGNRQTPPIKPPSSHLDTREAISISRLGQQGLGAQPAVTVKLSVTTVPPSRRGSGKGKDPETVIDIDIEVAPLHLFVDVPQILGDGTSFERSEVLSFVDELRSVIADDLSSPRKEERFSEDEDETEDDEIKTPPGTPRARQKYSHRQVEREREEERRRLERLVLEDLDLGFDYGQTAPEAKKGLRDATPTRARRKVSLHVCSSCKI